MGCGCGRRGNTRGVRSGGRQTTGQARLTRTSRASASSNNNQAQIQTVQNSESATEQDKLRVQKLRREAIFKALGHY